MYFTLIIEVFFPYPPSLILIQLPNGFYRAADLELITGEGKRVVHEYPLPDTDHVFNYSNSIGFQYEAKAVRQAFDEGRSKADYLRQIDNR